jgi:outer membrane protein OmpA-like peptidoglycan-associated protein
MEPGCPSFSLTQPWAEERIFLVDKLDAIRLCSQGAYEAVSAWKALWELGNLFPRDPFRLRIFTGKVRLICFQQSSINDDMLMELVKMSVQHGDLVAIKLGQPVELSGPAKRSQELRRIARSIDNKTHGRLSASGRQYQLVADEELSRMPNRDSYEVVQLVDAQEVLDALANQPGTGPDLAELFKQARDNLTRDWERPYEADGLILMRRIFTPQAATSNNEPSITPSQLRALMESEKPVQFFARFVDDFGKPVTGFAGEFAHGRDPKCEMTFSGSDFTRMGELKGAKQAWLTFKDKANQDLVGQLKKCWKEVRGEADDTWKEREGSLVEVLFKDGKLPELALEAEKKHTFMLRPPVALARLHGMYFDTNKCFLLPTAVASLKHLVETYALHPDSEVLIVGHTDTAGSEAYNLELSAERAEAMMAYLCDDADTWLGWYEADVRASKRWGQHEDLSMIDALVPDDQFGEGSHVAAYQTWHNGEAPDARQEDQPRSQPDGWEELKVDGILGPKTRRQLILDYMNLDGTSLEDDVRVVTYGCGEYFPLEDEEGEVDQDAAKADDGDDVKFDRRVEVFFFAKPFGILPPVPGVDDGETSKTATKAAEGDPLYPEWRRRASRFYAIDTESDGFRMRLCDDDSEPYAERPFTFCLEGYPEICGTTDQDGFVIIDSPPSGAQGYVEVWPDDDQPDDKIRWDIEITSIISPRTPQGASTRLENLDYFASDPTDAMTDELREAIGYFQSESEGLEVTCELDSATANRLGDLHDCEDEGSESPATADGSTT